MSSSTITVEAGSRTHWTTRALDYLELTKPKIAVMVLVTVAAAAVVASWGQPDPLAVVHALLGTTLVAASASALNQWLERNDDAQMKRTATRPLPAGRLTSREVLFFAALTIIAGLVYLSLLVNWQTAAWGLATWVVYVWIYTPLKYRTSLNTAVGAVSGALPVLMGWSAVGGALDVRALSMFLIVFLWQFPHFMAIAWMYRTEYRRAGVKMLTVVESSGRSAGYQAVLGALALLPISLIPALDIPGPGKVAYALLVLAIGCGQLACAANFLRDRSDRTSRVLLRASLVYLPTMMFLLMQLPLL